MTLYVFDIFLRPVPPLALAPLTTLLVGAVACWRADVVAKRRRLHVAGK